MFQRCVPLWDIFIGFLILLLQPDYGVDTLISKSMGECHFRFLVIGVTKPERIHIFRIPKIPLWSLDFFCLIPKPNRKVCQKCCIAITIRCCFVYQCAFGYNNIPVCIGDIF